jgi:FecR protein
MNSSMPDDDEVGRLIGEAGPQPSMPADDLAAIRDRARAEWKKHHGRRSRFRLVALPLAAALAGVALLSLWTLRRPASVPAPVALVAGRVERVRGEVRVRRANGMTERLLAGEELRSGTVIVTGDQSGSRAALRLAGGQSLRLDAGGEVLLAAAPVVRLDRGAVYVDSPGGAVPDSITVRTAAGDFHPAGTQFEVRIDAGHAIQLHVREGEVRLNRGWASIAARAGETLTIEPAGSLVRGQIAPNDQAWDWVVDAAPVPAIEGRSLATFLRWVARERGWKLVFEGDTSSVSESTTLHGSVGQLSLENALRTVTLSSGVDARYANGTLIVSAARVSGAPTRSRPTR